MSTKAAAILLSAVILAAPVPALSQTDPALPEADASVSPPTPLPPDTQDCGRRTLPPLAIHREQLGKTMLTFNIGTDGRTKDIVVTQSSGSPDLDEAAAAGAACWRYKPATKSGQPLEVPWHAAINWGTRR